MWLGFYFLITHLKSLIMTSKVTVTADENGNVIAVSQNNPEYGSVRIEQSSHQINSKGWLKLTKRSAFIKGLVKDLVAADFKAGQQLTGKIVVKESFTPFNPVNPEKDLKIAGDTGIVCRVEDQPIYRQSFFTTDDNATDELIMHTNTEEIREVQAITRSLYNLQELEAQPAL
jgi:hypothetical protein